jgi:hypothetical protein
LQICGRLEEEAEKTAASAEALLRERSRRLDHLAQGLSHLVSVGLLGALLIGLLIGVGSTLPSFAIVATLPGSKSRLNAVSLALFVLQLVAVFVTVANLVWGTTVRGWIRSLEIIVAGWARGAFKRILGY